MDESTQIVRRPCGAKTYLGTPCNNYPPPGADRCRFHGGATPDSIRKSAERLAFLREPAIEVHHKVMQDFLSEVDCEKCGRSRADPGPALRAAVTVLDRTGLHPSLSIEAVKKAEQEQERPFKDFTTDEIAEYADQLADASRIKAGWSLEQIADHLEQRARELRAKARAESISTDAEVTDEAVILAPRFGTFPSRNDPMNLQSEQNKSVECTDVQPHVEITCRGPVSSDVVTSQPATESVSNGTESLTNPD